MNKRVDEPRTIDTGAEDHLVLLDESWALWRCVYLRSAGFPAAWVLRLSAADGAAAADRLLVAEDQLELAFEKATRQAFKGLEVLAEGGERNRRNSIIRQALMALKQGKNPKKGGGDLDPEARRILEIARRSLEKEQELFRKSFQEALEQQSQVLFEVASCELFREAVVWQNRGAFHNAVNKLTQHPPEESPRNSRRRQWESMVANYLQRYCMKNETIGFFGPAGWGRLEDRGEVLRAEPGSKLLVDRKTYFEGWGIDALADALFEEMGAAMKPWLRPRRFPFLFVQGTTVHRLDGAPVQLDSAALWILRAADGQSPARELATRFASDPEMADAGLDLFYEILERLVVQGLLAWRLEVPLTMSPESALRQELERIGDPSVRRAALEKLEELETARLAVAEAAGDSGSLDRALQHLENTFTRLTDQKALRAQGKVFAVGPSRTLVFEDCRRDVALSLGPKIWTSLAPSLSIVLTSARWLSDALAARTRQVFHSTFDALSAQLSSRVVPLALFCQHAVPKISVPARELAAEFQSRWQRLLPVEASRRAVSFTADEVRRRAEELFEAAEPGWRNARYHSPDILLAAEGVEAIQRGDFHFVLGELHPVANTLETGMVMGHHPKPEELQRAIDLDLSAPGMHLALPKFWDGMHNPGFPIPAASTRSHVCFYPTEDHVLELHAHPSDVPPKKSIPFGGALVEMRDGALVVPSVDGSRVFDLLDVLALLLRQISWDIFKLAPPGRHTPRMTIDQLTVQRESWSFPVAEIPFLKLSDEQDRFLAVRRWAREHDLPNFTFFKSPLEHKPVFLNLQSPISIEIFVKMIRRLNRQDPERFSFTVSEMLPSPEKIWLNDAEGQLYTSELRLVAVDRIICETNPTITRSDHEHYSMERRTWFSTGGRGRGSNGSR